MKHTLVSCTLVKKAKDWKDQMVGWHTWKVVTRCPKNNKLVTERVSGRQDEAVQSCINYPECPCQEEQNV